MPGTVGGRRDQQTQREVPAIRSEREPYWRRRFQPQERGARKSPRARKDHHAGNFAKCEVGPIPRDLAVHAGTLLIRVGWKPGAYLQQATALADWCSRRPDDRRRETRSSRHQGVYPRTLSAERPASGGCTVELRRCRQADPASSPPTGIIRIVAWADRRQPDPNQRVYRLSIASFYTVGPLARIHRRYTKTVYLGNRKVYEKLCVAGRSCFAREPDFFVFGVHISGTAIWWGALSIFSVGGNLGSALSPFLVSVGLVWFGLVFNNLSSPSSPAIPAFRAP